MAKSFHGDILDFVIYNESISILNMKRYKHCEKLILDHIPIYDFKKDLRVIKLSGSTYFEKYKASYICRKEPFHPMLFPLRRTMKESELFCQTLHGGLVLPNNDKENELIYDSFIKYEKICHTTWPGYFWIGIDGDLERKRWIKQSDEEEVRFEKFIPGFEMVTKKLQCASAGASSNKYQWLSTPCEEYLCPVCNFTTWPLVHIRGLCSLSFIDTILYVHGYENSQPVIHGAYHSIIYWGGKGWELRSRQYKDLHANMLSKKPGEFLIGLHHWHFDGDQCESNEVRFILNAN